MVCSSAWKFERSDFRAGVPASGNGSGEPSRFGCVRRHPHGSGGEVGDSGIRRRRARAIATSHYAAGKKPPLKAALRKRWNA